MSQGWKISCLLFSFAAVIYGLGLIFDISFYLMHFLDQCDGVNTESCHIIGQDKYFLAAGCLVSATMAKISFNQNARINGPKNYSNENILSNIFTQDVQVPNLPLDGFMNPIFAYLLLIANTVFFFSYFDTGDDEEIIVSILIHIVLTITYGVFYKSEFWKGIGIVFIAWFVTLFLVVLTSFSEMSIFILIISGVIIVGVIINYHANKKHERAVGILYGLPIGFFVMTFVLFLIIFGEF